MPEIRTNSWFVSNSFRSFLWSRAWLMKTWTRNCKRVSKKNYLSGVSQRLIHWGLAGKSPKPRRFPSSVERVHRRLFLPVGLPGAKRLFRNQSAFWRCLVFLRQGKKREKNPPPKKTKKKEKKKKKKRIGRLHSARYHCSISNSSTSAGEVVLQ